MHAVSMQEGLRIALQMGRCTCLAVGGVKGVLGIDERRCATRPLHLRHGMVGQRCLPAALRPIHLFIPTYPMSLFSQ